MNIFKASLTDNGELFLDNTKMAIENQDVIAGLKAGGYFGKNIIVGVRPEHITIEKTTQFSKGINTIVTDYELLGSDSLVYFNVDGQQVIAKSKVRDIIENGTPVTVNFNMNSVYFFDNETEERIYAK